MASKTEELGSTVAKHYNELQDGGLEERLLSRICYQRNYHNWLKSMAIGSVLDKIRQERGRHQPIRVLDLCSGKGGDLLKWKKGSIDSLVCADIAATSVEQCEGRYKEMVTRSQNERQPQKLFTAEFIAADCSKVRLRDVYKDPAAAQFDLVSCQFALHYAFESEAQARLMLRNACEALRPGGYFIGTTPNAYEMIKRLRAAEGLTYGNEVYRITFDPSTDKQNIPLFGAKYDFHLEGVVNCPEFLVYFPLLEKMAEEFDMELVYRTPFAELFLEHIESSEGRGLAGRMQAFEPYPADHDVELMSKDADSYAYASDFLIRLGAKGSEGDRLGEPRQEGGSEGGHKPDEGRRGQNTKPLKVGTLSKPEWEASTLYLAFAFRRRCHEATPNLSTTPVTEIGYESTRKRRHDDTTEGAVPKKVLCREGDQ